MDALGRLLNVAPTANAVWISMKDCSAVTFLCTGADTYTLAQATSAAGASSVNLAVITRYQTSTSPAGAAGWVEVTQAAAAAITIGAGIATFSVSSNSLGDGFTYLRVTRSAAGLVTAITHDLRMQRRANNLRALGI